LITRPIPHSGKRLPVVGLGTSQVFEVGNDPARRQACAEVLKTLVARFQPLKETPSAFRMHDLSVTCMRFGQPAGSGIPVPQNAIGSGPAGEFGSRPFDCGA
jgi:hypothetical protein